MQTPCSLFGPAIYYLFQLLSVECNLESLSYKVGSRELCASLPGHCTSPDIDSSVKVSVHEL